MAAARVGAYSTPVNWHYVPDEARYLFSDSGARAIIIHADLIGGIRSVFGEAGLDRLIEARQEAMVATYRQALEPHPDLGDRVGVLARMRTVEGYMAEFEMQSDGSFLLIENHCPICAAAKACQGFCRSELELFQAAFGADASVTRQEHLLSEGRRCVYRIARQDQSGGRGEERRN